MLGLERTNLFTQHKNHIAKLMVLAITGYAFEDHFETNVKAVWSRIPSANIAASHVLAYRVMEKVIKAKGGNNFITNGMHCGVRRDFVYTDEGIRPRRGGKLAAPDVEMSS
jgi:hypothetical protein